MTLAVVAALLFGSYTVFYLNDQICHHAQQLLANHYRNLDVEIGSAHFLKGQGIKLYDFSIYEPTPTGGRSPLLTVEEVFLQCPTRLEEILTGKLHVQKMVVKRPVLHATHKPNGSWNIEALWPTPRFGNQPPVVEVQNAVLLVDALSDQELVQLVVQEINLVLQPDGAVAGLEKPVTNAQALSDRGDYSLAATVNAPDKRFSLQGKFSTAGGGIDLTTDISDLKISPSLLKTLVAIGIESLEGVQLSGHVTGSARISRPPGVQQPLHYESQFALDQGTFDHPTLPRPLTDLSLHGRYDGNRLMVEKLTGKCGTAQLRLACNRVGWGDHAPLGLHAQMTGLPLDTTLLEILPEKFLPLWTRYAPSGHIDADLKLTFNGKNWFPQLTVVCQGVSFTENKHFPYPLKQGTGTIFFQRSASDPSGRLKLDLIASGHGRPIRIAGEFTDLFPESTHQNSEKKKGPPGWIEVSGTQVPIHPQLVDALKPDTQRIVRSLQPAGNIDFRWRLEKAERAQNKPHRSLELNLSGCEIRYDKFPYHLRHITGQVTCENEVWHFENLRSRNPNRTAAIQLVGELRRQPEGHRLQLTVTGSDIPLDDELFQSVPPKVQTVWRQLQPHGRINFVAEVDHLKVPQRTTAPTVRITAQPQRRSVSIEPSFLPYPYRLDQIEGNFAYANHQLTMTDVRARHGRIDFATQGQWQELADGGWQLNFTKFNADHLSTHNRDLLMALPLRLQKAINDLAPNGTFRLYDSAFEFRRPTGSLPRIASKWDLNLDCHQTDLYVGVPLEDLSGTIQLAGSSDGQQTSLSGQLDLDSVVWNQVQLTSVRGPIWINQTEAGSLCLLGRGASKKQQQTPRDISAEVYGGTLVGNIQVRNMGLPQFQLSAAVAGADVTRLANERFGQRDPMTGTLNGWINLAQTGRSPDAMSGRGEVHVVDANIYKLPLLVGLLKVLQNRTPNTTAFNQCDATFAIQGQHVHFDELNLLGDVVNLDGRGETNFQGDDLNLVFHAMVGQRRLPLISPLFSEASKQTLQLRVDGTLQDPIIHREALPAVKKTIEQIQAELQPTTTPIEHDANSRFPFWPFR